MMISLLYRGMYNTVWLKGSTRDEIAQAFNTSKGIKHMGQI
ncbi:MAG TPA: hypothetical protein VLA74_02990 [Nitrososphaeraceae archaeon]|nr:hypothetical protein [Nitrososphaeraceae archaeon]